MASEKAQFDLAERDVGSYVVHRDRERTHSFVHPSDVVGRDRDRELITDLLMHPGDGEGISVIPIVGIGGLGKTILAKFVYSDERLVCHFHMKLWVCVSENFDIKQLVGDLIESASGKKCDELSIDHLQTRLRNILNGKRFLLVLDDVWNEDRGRWIDLKSLLTSAANGSKILVTTRSHRVASIMGTVPEFKLGCLTHSACLSLFMRWAFQKGQEKDLPNLIEIGHEIVEKCKGVPLAVRTLGSLLYMNLDEREWLYVRDNEIWKLEQTETDILPALQLSYDQLPYYLKHCFAYCSIFPKDYVFRKDELIQLWMAQGLIIQLPHSNQELEDIGRRYFSLLWSRSFFQEAGEPGFSKTFKMHHLVHDLALSVAQTECMNICRETKNIPIKVRHISFHNHDLLEGQTPRFFLALKRLRSIFSTQSTKPNISFVKICISNFKYLRVLDLRRCSLMILPDSIGNLKHLRYLNLSMNFSIEMLPISICDLHSLQTFKLLGCERLQELPRNIHQMISLRHLYITIRQTSLPDVEIGNLTSLRSLWIHDSQNLLSFPVGLQNLSHLRHLTISNCRRLTFLPTNMGNLTTLERLHFSNCPKLNLVELDQNFRSLRSLIFEQLPQLVDLPEWTRSTANTLKILAIDYCYNLVSLPDWLGNLTDRKSVV